MDEFLGAVLSRFPVSLDSLDSDSRPPKSFVALQNRYHALHLKSTKLKQQNDLKRKKAQSATARLIQQTEKYCESRLKQNLEEAKLQKHRDEVKQKQQIKSLLRNRQRALVKMTKRQMDIDDETKGFALRLRIKEETLIDRIMKEADKQDREFRIQVAKQRRNTELSHKAEQHRIYEKRINQLRNQIALLEDEKKEAKVQREIYEKGQKELSRKMRQETKEFARKEISRIKDRILNEEQQNVIFRQHDAEQMKSFIRIRQAGNSIRRGTN